MVAETPPGVAVGCGDQPPVDLRAWLAAGVEASAGRSGAGSRAAGRRPAGTSRGCPAVADRRTGRRAGAGVVGDRGREAVGQQVADLLQQQDVLGGRGRLLLVAALAAGREGVQRQHDEEVDRPRR